jgi:hypothetical protein
MNKLKGPAVIGFRVGTFITVAILPFTLQGVFVTKYHFDTQIAHVREVQSLTTKRLEEKIDDLKLTMQKIDANVERLRGMRTALAIPGNTIHVPPKPVIGDTIYPHQ